MSTNAHTIVMRRRPLVAPDEAVQAIRQLSSTLLNRGRWFLDERRRRSLDALGPAELLRSSVRFAMTAKSEVSTHTLRLRRAGASDQFALVLRVADGAPSPAPPPASSPPGIDLAWSAHEPDEALLPVIAEWASSFGIDEATLGAPFGRATWLGRVTLLRDVPPAPPPLGARVVALGGRQWLFVGVSPDASGSQEADAVAERVAEWLRGEVLQDAPQAPVQLAVPSYLLPKNDRGEDAPDETQALPTPDVLRQRLIDAEPLVAIARAARQPPRDREPAAPTSAEALDPLDATAPAPTPEALRVALEAVVPFRPASVAALPMSLDDYAVLRALHTAKGDHDEAVVARYGTRSHEERREIDRRMWEHIEKDPQVRAAFDARFRHFLQYLRR